MQHVSDADKLLVKIGLDGWGAAVDWASSCGWSDEKVLLLLEYLEREGLVNVEGRESDDA